MEMTKERTSFTFDPRDILLSLQMGFSFVRAEVACAILKRTSGLKPSSETTAPRYLKLVTVPNFCPLALIMPRHKKVAGYYAIPLSVCPFLPPSAVHLCPLHNFDTVRDNFTKLGTNIKHDQATCRD